MATLQFEFVFRRSDYIVTIAALTRRSVKRRLLFMALWVALMLFLMGIMSGAREAGTNMLLLVGGNGPWTVYAAVIMILAAIWFRSDVVAAISGLWYRDSTFRDREMRLAFDEAGIDIDAQGISSRIAWGSVTRVIETPSHVVLAISTMQGVTLPRRAIASEQDYEALNEMIARHVPKAA